jgi:chromosome segregation ATPase
MKNSNSHADILQKGYDGLKKELAELNHLQLTMRTMYENLYDDYRDVKVELAQWKEYASELMSARHYLHKKNGKLEKEKAILENNAAKHKKEIETLASTISGMENELNKKDFEIDELSNTIQFASYILKNGGDIPRD